MSLHRFDAIETAILRSISQAIDRLPNGKAKPANGITMLIDISDFDFTEIQQVIPRIKKRSGLLNAVGTLGYKDIWLSGKTEDEVVQLWSNVELN